MLSSSIRRHVTPESLAKSSTEFSHFHGDRFFSFVLETCLEVYLEDKSWLEDLAKTSIYDRIHSLVYVFSRHSAAKLAGAFVDPSLRAKMTEELTSIQQGLVALLGEEKGQEVFSYAEVPMIEAARERPSVCEEMRRLALNPVVQDELVAQVQRMEEDLKRSRLEAQRHQEGHQASLQKVQNFLTLDVETLQKALTEVKNTIQNSWVQENNSSLTSFTLSEKGEKKKASWVKKVKEDRSSHIHAVSFMSLMDKVLLKTQPMPSSPSVERGGGCAHHQFSADVGRQALKNDGKMMSDMLKEPSFVEALALNCMLMEANEKPKKLREWLLVDETWNSQLCFAKTRSDLQIMILDHWMQQPQVWVDAVHEGAHQVLQSATLHAPKADRLTMEETLVEKLKASSLLQDAFARAAQATPESAVTPAEATKQESVEPDVVVPVRRSPKP